jgi:hypothetical protein
MKLWARVISMGAFLVVVGGVMQMVVMVIPGVALLGLGLLMAVTSK